MNPGKDSPLPVVAFLGPEATFSHEAAMALYGEKASFLAAESIEEVFALVEEGTCPKGIVPVENSLEGSVNITLDLLYMHETIICAEIYMRIRHHLLSRAERLKDIKQLYSHSQALAQCRSWIKANLPGIPMFEVASTSLAAKMAAGMPETAAVGSRFAGQTYGLLIVEADIEDHPDNVTRFLAVGKDRSGPTGKDKTSILFSLPHKPGALYQALGALAERGVNIMRIESRPNKIRNWEYMFYMDVEGHEEDDNIDKALKAMGKACEYLKRLGSYPLYKPDASPE